LRAMHVQDVEKGELQQMGKHWSATLGLRILGDGSKVLQLDRGCIRAWSMWTGELTGKMELKQDNVLGLHSLHMDGSRVLIHSKGLPAQGWDFGVTGSTPVQFYESSSDRPHLNLIDARQQSNIPVRIEDSVTKKEIFQLCGRYTDPLALQWDEQYLIAGYQLGGVLILDFSQ